MNDPRKGVDGKGQSFAHVLAESRLLFILQAVL